jgi:DnaJ family protein A protein 2
MAGRGGTDTRLYDILGVPRSSSDQDIKRAYHRLAKEFHPDKNPEHGDRFKEISYAYDVLSDPKKRETYDRFGLKGVQEGGSDDPFGGGFPGGIFEDLFGGGLGGMGGPFGGGLGSSFFFGGGGGGGRSRVQRGEDTVKPLRVTLEDLYNGKTTTVTVDRKTICSMCQGAGSRNAKSARPCADCRGSGVKVQLRQLGPGLVQQVHGVCSKCSGQGTIIPEKDRCKGCSGKKVRQETKEVEIQVEQGMMHNSKIPLKGQGDEEPNVIPGDLIYVVQQEPHETFERNGENLIMKHTISLVEALCGFQLVVKQLDGRNLVITQLPGEVVPSGSVHFVEDEGMPIHGRPFTKGKLLIKFKVEFPKEHFADEKQLKLLESLLPPRPEFERPEGDLVEDADLNDYEVMENNTADSDDEDDPRGGTRVGCAQQ